MLGTSDLTYVTVGPVIGIFASVIKEFVPNRMIPGINSFFK